MDLYAKVKELTEKVDALTGGSSLDEFSGAIQAIHTVLDGIQEGLAAVETRLDAIEAALAEEA